MHKVRVVIREVVTYQFEMAVSDPHDDERVEASAMTHFEHMDGADRDEAFWAVNDVQVTGVEVLT